MIKEYNKAIYKYIQIVICLFLFLGINSCTVKKRTITTNDDIKKIIEEDKEYNVFLLKEGVYLNTQEINVPNGITIEGEKNTIFRRTKAFNGLPVFNLSNASNVTIKNISIELFSNSKGIISNSKEQSKNIFLQKINFKGNLYNDQIKKNKQSNLSLSIENVLDLEIDNLSFHNTFGGIYLNKIANGNITNNTLKEVNFGNIVVSNSKNIKIDNNNILQPGKGSKYNHASGDGMTFGGENDSIFITNNKLSHGYCYLIWVVGSINNSTISKNIFDSGVTTSLCINNGDNISIINNKFISGLANGILLNDNYNNVVIEENHFFNDGIISRNNESKNIKIVNNIFDENYIGERFVGVVGKTTKKEKNIVNYIKNDTLSSFVLLDENDKVIKSGDTYNLVPNSMTFRIKNTGSKRVSFSGFPQIILKDTVLSKDSRGDRKSGTTVNKSFYISSRNQPNVLTLEKAETASFKLNSTGEQNTTILNIPTLFKSLNPFWIKIDKNNN